MQLFVNTTSPFARMVRIAAHEKGLMDRIEERVIDPWTDPAEFLAANSAGRVPALVTGDGTAISESLLVLHWLDRLAPDPALFPAARLGAVLATCGDAIGAFEGATAIIIGRKSNPDFDSHMVGQRRRRSMAHGLARLNAADLPEFAESPDAGAIAAATAVDYILFRFGHEDWLAGLDRLRDWRNRAADRPSLVATMPYV